MTTDILVYNSGTAIGISGATVTCTGKEDKITNSFGYTSFDLHVATEYTITARADGYYHQASVTTFGGIYLIKLDLHPLYRYEFWTQCASGGSEYPLPNALVHVDDVSGATLPKTCTPSWYQVGYVCALLLGEGVSYKAWTEKAGFKAMTPIAFTAEDNGTLVLTLNPRLPSVVTEEASIIKDTSAQLNGLITDMDGLASASYHFTYWCASLPATNTPTHNTTGPIAVSSVITNLQPGTTYSYETVAFHETEGFIFYAFGDTKQFTTLAGPTEGMTIVLPNENDKLFLSNTVIACDDQAKACTDFNFQIRNDSGDQMLAWYKVSIVGGGTLYEDTTPSLIPGETSYIINGWVCALPGGLPVGTHTIKVEVGSEVSTTATDTYTEDLYVIEAIPAVETVGATQTDDTTVRLEGNLTYMADSPSCDVYFMAGLDASCAVSSKDIGIFDTLTSPNIYQLPIGGIPVGATVYYKAAADCSGHATVYGEVKQITLTEGPIGAPPSGVGAGGVNYLNVCGAEIANNCVTADINVEHFGSDSECTIYLEYWSEGDFEHNFTTPIIVPYDPLYDEGGFEVQGVEACIQDCEKDLHIRAVASNSIGTSYSEVETPITVRLEAPTEVTQTSITLNAYITSMGSVTTGVAGFNYGTPTPDTTTFPLIEFSNVGPISYTVTGLAPDITYQYYLFARYKYGCPQTLSTTLSFTTLVAYDITFIATAPGISDLHNVDVTDTTNPINHIYLGRT